MTWKALNFSLDDPRGDADDDHRGGSMDPDALFNLPKGGADDEDDDRR